MISSSYIPARSLLRCPGIVKAGCSAGIRTGRFPLYNPLTRRQIAKRFFWKIHRDGKPIQTKHPSDLMGNIAIMAFAFVTGLPYMPIVAKLWLDYGSYQKMLTPKHLQDDRMDDLRDVVLEHSVPTQAGNPKLTGQYYQPLVRKDDIRLLVLHPGVSRDEIVFHMDNVALHTTELRYEALSYAWGNEAASQSIYAFDGMRRPVTPTLHLALQHLRYKDRMRILWIDALCIDQLDIDERSHQVRLMGDIYARADRVVIWLGEEDEHTLAAFSSLEKLYTKYWQSNLWHVTWSKEQGSQYLIKKFVARTTPELIPLERHFQSNILEGQFAGDINAGIRNFEWTSVRALFQRSWFHRLWVIQEVSNAKRAIVLCGNSTISWNVLATSATYLMENDLTKYLDPLCDLACNSVASIQQTRRHRTRDPLFTVALDNTYGGCRDPKDKIFALMSISAGRDNFDWEISFDYALPFEELYKRFAIWDITRNRTLRTLSCGTSASPGSATVILPSWVPDWTRILDRYLLVRANGSSKFCAGVERDWEVWFSHDKSVVHVEGVIVDGVDTLGSAPYRLKTTSLLDIDAETIVHIKALRSWLLECWDIAKADRPMDNGSYNAFWRTMLCDLDSSGHPAPQTYAKNFLKYFKFVREAPAIFHTILENSAPIEPYGIGAIEKSVNDFMSIDALSDAHDLGSRELHVWFDQHVHTNTLIEDSLQKWGRSKRFCRTRDGRLARVPDLASVNDVICILNGSEVPHVLRKKEDGTYVVIGECYVHGIMRGEAVKLATHKPEILRLR